MSATPLRRGEVIDAFAGPGGWEVAARELGLDPLGIEYDADACATRAVAGLRTIRADVAALDPRAFIDVCGFIGSPPCPSFSVGGKRLGLEDLPHIITCATELGRGHDTRASHEWRDPRSILTIEPLRWVLALRPEWCAWEQVPAVLPLWQHFAEILRGHGYRTATGVLHAEQYGTPQTRKRAVLIAARGRDVALPTPTHRRHRPAGSAVPPDEQHLPLPVTMHDALGWGMTARPSMTVTGGGSSTGGAEPFGNGARQSMRREHAAGRWGAKPLGSGSGSQRSIRAEVEAGAYIERAPDGALNPRGSIRVTAEEAAALQGFPAGYPFHGTGGARFQQIGNAVPPPLARAVLAAVIPPDTATELEAVA